LDDFPAGRNNNLYFLDFQPVLTLTWPIDDDNIFDSL